MELGSDLYTAVVSLLTAFVLVVAVRRRYFSGVISDVPGPFWASFSTLWELWTIIEGHLEIAVIALHERHGKNLWPRHRCSCGPNVSQL